MCERDGESSRNREGTNTKNSVKFPGTEQVNVYGGHVLHVGVHTSVSWLNFITRV